MMRKQLSTIWTGHIAIVCLTLCVVASCDEIAPPVKTPVSYPGDTYGEVFESFWNGMNNNYVFWNADTVNWDQKYSFYKPRFAALSAFSTANDRVAEQYFTAMTANLIDSHYTLTFIRTGHQVYPALNRKIAINKAHPDSIYSLPASLFTTVIPQNYIDEGTLKMGTDTIVENAAKFGYTAMTGKINNNILYLWMNGFFFSQAGSNVTPVLNSFFSQIQNKTLAGIIVDVRENGGGEVSDLDFLIGSFISSPFQFGSTRQKSNIGRLDYTPLAPAIITPRSGSVNLTIPIVALSDHLSISLAEMTTLVINSLPNGKSIGTTTWGANGPLAPIADFNAGQFTVGDDKEYMSVYTSSTEFTALNGTLFEGKGIPPGKWVTVTSAALNQGVDLQLAAAIDYINAH